MHRLALIVATFLTLATDARAGEVVQNPRWLALPAPDAAGYLMPAFANLIGVSGTVTLRCWVERVGPPENCEVVASSPEGLGFAQAALEIAQYGILQPKLIDGTAVRGSIQFNLPFQAYPLPPRLRVPQPYTGQEPTAEAIDLGKQFVRVHLDDMRKQAEAEMFGGLAEDRRQTVRSWIEELLPINEKKVVDTLGLMLARLVPEAELRRAVESDAPFSRDIPTNDEWNAATVDLFDRQDEKAVRELRTRYCATYECDINPRVAP